MSFKFIKNYYSLKENGQYYFDSNKCAYAIGVESFLKAKINELLCMQIFDEDYMVISGFNDVFDTFYSNNPQHIYKLSLLLENLKISDIGVCHITFSNLKDLSREVIQFNCVDYTIHIRNSDKKGMYDFISDIKQIAKEISSSYLQSNEFKYDRYAAYLDKPYILGGRDKYCHEIGRTDLYKIKAILIEKCE